MKAIKQVIVAAFAAAAGVAQAAFPVGQWQFDAYVDSTGNFYSTNGMCLLADGTWYATTSGAGSGRWYMKGNDVLIHGAYGSSATAGAVQEAGQLIRINDQLMGGMWQEWNPSYSFNNYYTMKFTFVSATCNPASR